jgi:hypothetical protein
VSEWQPIETAPKDGTRILIFGARECYGGDYISLAYWDHWWRGDYDEPVYVDEPTHWMPLPPPPQQA